MCDRWSLSRKRIESTAREEARLRKRISSTQRVPLLGLCLLLVGMMTFPASIALAEGPPLLEGMVTDADTGIGIPSAQITANEISDGGGGGGGGGGSAGNGSISGRIIDRWSGDAIEGATVFVDVLPQVGGASPFQATTDANGQFLLTGLGGDAVDLQVWATDYGNRFVTGTDTGGTDLGDLALDPVEGDDEYLVVVLVDFANLAFHPQHDEAWFDRLLFDDTPGAASVRNYFYEASRGHLRLRKGAMAKVTAMDSDLLYPHDNYMRDDLADWALPAADSQIDYSAPELDRFDNYDRDPGADGDLDLVLVIPAGLPQSLTGQKDCDMNPVSMWNTISGLDGKTARYQVVSPEYSPVGNFAHELMHSMGEQRVQDLYIGGSCDDESVDDLATVGKWDMMSVGMYNAFDSAFVDPRGESCETAYVAPCADGDPDCWINRAGASPSYPGPWVMRERWYRQFYLDRVTTVSVSSGSSQTITLHPYAGSGPETRIIQANDPSNSSANWYITLRSPLGFDRGLENPAIPAGDTGVVIDYTDRSLTGSQNLRGPVRVRDARPGTPPPSYLHFACRFQVDDAAFELGEIDSYSEGPLSVQILAENADGSVEVQVSVGNSLKSTPSSTRPTVRELETDHHDHDHAVLPGLIQGLRGEQSARCRPHSRTKSSQVVWTDAQGYYTLPGVTPGTWSLEVSAEGYGSHQEEVMVSTPTTVDVGLVANPSDPDPDPDPDPEPDPTDARILVIDRDGGDAVGGVGLEQALVDALHSVGVSEVVLSSDDPSDLDLGSYDAVFLTLGAYPSAGYLNSTESNVLRDFLAAGGRLYIEGGDVGFSHRYKSFWSYLGTTYVKDGRSDNEIGATETGAGFAEGLSFVYTNEDDTVASYVDELLPGTGGVALWHSSGNIRSSDVRAVASAHVDGALTVTSSICFGGLGGSAVDRAEYISRILLWLDI